MATGQTFLSLNNSRRQRDLHNHHHHNSHAFHHHNTTQNPFQNQFLNPLARAYHHLTATLPSATQPHHHFHHNTFHNAKISDLNEDDSLSSVSMLSSEQAKRKVRWILSLGLLLPALAAIIGVVAWAVSAEVVMGVQREAALRNQEFHNNHAPDDLLFDLETRKLYTPVKSELGKQRNGPRSVFGERINSNFKSLANSESKSNLISNENNRISNSEDNLNNNENLNGNGLNQEPKLIASLLPSKVTEMTKEKTIDEEIESKTENWVENQNLQSNLDKNDLKQNSPLNNNQTGSETKNGLEENTNDDDSDEEKATEDMSKEEMPKNENSKDENVNDENAKDENTKDENTKDENSGDENLKEENLKEESPKEENFKDESTKNLNSKNENSLSSTEEKTPDSINEKIEVTEESTITPLVTTKITAKLETTSSKSDGEKTTKSVVLNQQNNNDQNEKAFKKSAGAQVAEVIDKLVSQRQNSGVPGIPHIVVVAPFRLKNGNKKLTVTEGNVHGIPGFGTRSISAQSLANMLSNSNKENNNKPNIINKILTTITTTISTTPSTTTTEEIKSTLIDESVDDASASKSNENTEKSEENTEKLNENKEAKSSGESEANKENNRNDSDDDDDSEEDEDTTTSTTSKPVLINRIREAVRTQTKKEKQLTDKRENNQKRNEKSNEKLSLNASTKHKDKEQERTDKPKTRSSKTILKKNKGGLLTINHDSKNNSSIIDDSLRRMDEVFPEKIISMDLTNEEDLFLKDSEFPKKTSSLEKAFKELEKSKNLKYQEHEYIHQTKEQETYMGLSSNNHKQTIKQILNLQPITQPSSSPPPQPQINQHFLVNTNSKNQQQLNRNNQNNFNKEFMNNPKQHNNPNSNSNHNSKFPQQPQQQFTLEDHRPSERLLNNKPASFNINKNLNQNIKQKGAIFHKINKGQAPAPFIYQINQKRHQGLVHNNFATQQSQQQKQILNQLLQANAASSNQIQRSMNVNSGANVNQLNHLKLSQQNSRSVHIPKQQLIQHIQMLSNLNSKHTFPAQQSPQQILNTPQQNLNSLAPIGPTASIGPDQYVELNQMMDAKLSPSTLAAANAHFMQEQQNFRNLQNLQNMENGNAFLGADTNNHVLNVQPTKPQIHYADQPSNQINHFTDVSNINPTNQPNLQEAESIGHSQHSASNNLLSVGDSSNSALVNFNLKDPPGSDKGLKMSFGSGPSSGGAQLITNPLGIFKSIFLPLLPKPRMNLNGKVVFGVVLDTSLRKPAPKVHHPVIVVPAKHHFFG